MRYDAKQTLEFLQQGRYYDFLDSWNRVRHSDGVHEVIEALNQWTHADAECMRNWRDFVYSQQKSMNYTITSFYITAHQAGLNIDVLTDLCVHMPSQAYSFCMAFRQKLSKSQMQVIMVHPIARKNLLHNIREYYDGQNNGVDPKRYIDIFLELHEDITLFSHYILQTVSRLDKKDIEMMARQFSCKIEELALLSCVVGITTPKTAQEEAWVALYHVAGYDAAVNQVPLMDYREETIHWQ